MKTYIYWLLIGVLLSIALTSCGDKEKTIFPVIPQPNSLTFQEGEFLFSDQTNVHTNLDDNKKINKWFSDLPIHSVRNIEINSNQQEGINLLLDTISNSSDSPEAYEMIISRSSIFIRGKSEAGLYYGVQTLIQLYNEYRGRIPAMSIIDFPRFAVRSLMLDASSFYVTPDFIKKQIDAMASYKLNRLQWLIGGEGGWRIPIPEYPELVEKTAYRSVKNFQDMVMSGYGFCSKETVNAYGGYYSHAEIQDIVAYAAERNITVVPAIDLPCAHHKIAQTATISCADKDQAKFIRTVLSRFIELFPSEYVYIGNGLADDSYGTVCKSCRKKVDQNDIIDENEPYTIIIREAESYLKLHGKKLMTWEESLRMGLSKDATIVSWHDREDGITAASRGYNVILSPSDVSSLNFYQSNPSESPKAMSGFLPLERIYAFNPIIPDTIQNTINGIQVNMWTHIIDNESDIEYMLYPRLLAAAEIGWTEPVRKSYPDFKRRALKANNTLRKKSYHSFDLSNESVLRPEQTKPVINLAKYKPVEYNSMFGVEFPASGLGSLVDGVCGGWYYTDGNWQGFPGEQMSVTIDLEKQTNITYVSASFITDVIANVYLPIEVRIFTSNDGVEFEKLETVKNDLPTYIEGYKVVDFGWKGSASTRYIKYEAQKVEKQGSWLFTDEIIIQ